MVKLLKSEPAAVAGAVQAVIALVVAFGLSLSADQIGAIMAVVAAALALVVRQNVAPAVADPTPVAALAVVPAVPAPVAPASDPPAAS